ncbi:MULTISPECIES: hypothetical protein [Halomicrobium]|uniref:Nickel/cobalt efflux system n=2 Tax=Halomicrobium mukohataei TaxID=57705 RepID=C7NZD6_HALMD|nr:MULTISPECIES: hypothetical protein [Halomicrobium]ACV46822.1 conserved hypothetical protein [Halomicrobium mukohataei DSM 12286]QCD65324.1 hypothetical protein E5139_06630 [Halomicrobium mukohataei]QFR20130.1 hypothetical protein GBQ70_06625 [Halomicrobium sp. ZPS1]
MMYFEGAGLLIGAIALGAIHGIEPGHGWPVAASYALDQTNKWAYGFAASLILGVGHLVSSIAMVGAFFYAKEYFSLTQVNEPITVVGGLQIGGPVSLVAGVLLIALGLREYLSGHTHGTSTGHDHGHTHGTDDGHGGHHHTGTDDHGHGDGSHEHHSEADEHAQSRERADRSLVDRLILPAVNLSRISPPWGGEYLNEVTAGSMKTVVPFVGGGHAHGEMDTDRGLLGIAWFAFVLGFAHEEEFEIIALCAGSDACLELMGAYALTVVVGIVGLTMLLIAGYERCEERVEQYTPYLPVFSALVLVVMGIGFVTGIF